VTFPAPEVAQAVGKEPLRWEPAAGSGYGINTSRWRVAFADGGSAFVKVALDEGAAGWLRLEHNVYANVAAPFLPELQGWHDDGVTLLAIDDLSDAHWPPPWPREGVDAVLTALAELHATRPPSGLGSLEDLRDELNGWARIAADPDPFLSLGVCTPTWLHAALPQLEEAAAACELEGDAFMHLDVRSDNLCLRDGRAVFVDWNWASIGNPLLDVVAWLPSLRLEGGPEPWEIVADSEGLAALMAGYFMSAAGLPPPKTAPNVRDIQKRQGELALAWAARELGLPDLDSGP
jgi:Phosphotransferase enzyme family